MYDPLLMNSFKSFNQASNKELSLVMRELSNHRMVVSKISSLHQVHNQIEHTLVMESILNIYDEVRIKSAH